VSQAPTPSLDAYNQGGAQTVELHMDVTTTWQKAVELQTHCDDLADAHNKLQDALDAITHNLDGETQREIADFFKNYWNPAFTALFGPTDAPKLGVLSRMVVGLKTAALNYDQTETDIGDAWQKYTDLLNSLLGGSPPGKQTGGSDSSDQPPISEV